MSFIYLDHHATTPCDPRVLEAMLPWFVDAYGNPGSGHYLQGAGAREAVARARLQVAEILGANPTDLIFTAGATEAINLGLKGLVDASGPGPHRIVTTTIEHDAVLQTCAVLERRGVEVVRLPVGADGLVDPDAVRSAVVPGALVVTVMAANNEIGTLQPMAEIGEICREVGVPLMSDIAQSLGKVPMDMGRLGVDLAAMSAHKLYGPKGVGALYVRSSSRAARLRPQVHGASQERGLRAGTLNVPGIVGFGAACAIAHREMAAEAERTCGLRDRLLAGLRAGLGEVLVNGSMEHRLPQNLHISIPGVEARAVLEALPHVGMSAGSACTAEETRLSHVLVALGLPEDRALCSLRFGVGRSTTEAEVDDAVQRIVEVATRLRRSP